MLKLCLSLPFFMKKISIALIGLIMFSCGGSSASVYKSAIQLTKENVHSKISGINVNLPLNWFAADDNECNCTDIWLVKNDYSNSISIRKINTDAKTLDDIIKQGIGYAVYLSKMFVKSKLGINYDNFSGEETYNLNGRLLSSYQYNNKVGNKIRVVVFEYEGKFYECEAVSINGKNLDELFCTQNAVMVSIN